MIKDRSVWENVTVFNDFCDFKKFYKFAWRYSNLSPVEGWGKSKLSDKYDALSILLLYWKKSTNFREKITSFSICYWLISNYCKATLRLFTYYDTLEGWSSVLRNVTRENGGRGKSRVGLQGWSIELQQPLKAFISQRMEGLFKVTTFVGEMFVLRFLNGTLVRRWNVKIWYLKAA